MSQCRMYEPLPDGQRKTCGQPGRCHEGVTALERALIQHGLKVKQPSQLADSFRNGWAAALSAERGGEAVLLRNTDGAILVAVENAAQESEGTSEPGLPNAGRSERADAAISSDRPAPVAAPDALAEELDQLLAVARGASYSECMEAAIHIAQFAQRNGDAILAALRGGSHD